MSAANRAFYRTNAPLAHFRTSLIAADVLASVFVPLLAAVAAEGTSSAELKFVDVGAGDGRLCEAVLRSIEASDHGWRDDVEVIAIDQRQRPDALDRRVQWRECDATTADLGAMHGVLVAHEWLDDIGVDVAIRRDGGWWLQHVNGIDEPLAAADARVRWIKRWWPDADRVELGHHRDHAWANVTSGVMRGYAIAVDYGHTRDARPVDATVAGYRNGALAPIAFDGSVNVTAHVALDACGAAGTGKLTRATALLTQRDALTAAGVTSATGRPRDPVEPRAARDARDELRGVAAQSQRHELIAPGGVGDHLWLVHAVEMPLPEAWRDRAMSRTQTQTQTHGSSM